jgi:alpha-amylase/alpha-mannosidase (GH57 family)
LSETHVCIHAHFYQPPRENPWLEEVEPEPSAAPYHDWNERITAECYAPNGAARITDANGRIKAIRNNYASISFNFGPTLLGWMELKAPATYAAILEADAESVERFDGHGSALAQPYNHMIMPLANARDRRTQVAWGLADFRRRFGRDPEGMWLPETAVDLDTLEALAEGGIRFTVLAPHQAARVRSPGGEWHDVGPEGPDTAVPYRQVLPSGRVMSLFFYDGPTSRAVAFEKLLDDGETLATRLMGIARSRDEAGGGLVHIATDGETYGHHHGHGDMALAVALGRIEREPGVRLSNYALYLAEHPPEHEVQIREATAWSCAHGVERWRSDCGCSTGGEADWNQAWRVPLRDSLDGLSSELARVFEETAEGILADPWKARDAYIEVVLGSDAERTAFLDAWCIGDGDQARALALRLLEMQRCAMLMFTSCGWFFNDLAGIETRQILLYAARALDLADSVEAGDVRDDFMERLSEAEGNGPEARNGRALFLDESRAARVSAPDIAADWVARQVAEVPGWDYVVWRAEGRWAAASTPEARSVAGEIRVTDRRTASNSDLRGRALARAPDRLRIEIRSESNGPGGTARSRTLERADLHPDTRSAIEETDEKSGERDATIGAIWATIETLAGAGAEGREEILGELDALLARAELDELELPLWALQNAWWRLTRNRAGPLDDVEASVAVRLGFAP